MIIVLDILFKIWLIIRDIVRYGWMSETSYLCMMPIILTVMIPMTLQCWFMREYRHPGHCGLREASQEQLRATVHQHGERETAELHEPANLHHGDGDIWGRGDQAGRDPLWKQRRCHRDVWIGTIASIEDFVNNKKHDIFSITHILNSLSSFKIILSNVKKNRMWNC